MPHATLMSAADTGILVVDVQEKLMRLIPEGKRLVGNISFLLTAARLLDMPIQGTEQYPKGLGGTVPELLDFLPTRPDKLEFSSCAASQVVDSFQREARPKLVVVGIETHVCILHTTLDLLNLGFRVYLPVDAVASRQRLDHDIALGRLQQAGAILTTTEGCPFEWVGGAHHPKFKEISKLVQDRMKSLTNS